MVIRLELVHDGDLLLLIERMLHLRGLDTVRITKVKGHADEGMVLDGRVRELDRLGNDAADEAADSGRRRVSNAVIDARRNLCGVCGRWYPVSSDLPRFFIAISRVVVILMVGWHRSLDGALDSGNVSSAWMIWASEVEAALPDAYRFAGGPVPDRGLVLEVFLDLVL